ncbi:uncharacterized protein FIBRA_08682 [Fibroporia radiculosa]|uniref:SET domain-containing protein n=1 Tax=Fibroporia radiculosa TaxID=599839 RepID=J4ICH5_9APHY|nr:uncharacterized protein FIBRA_08682 [Fibroporia radiculosa]CCM06421.1 predicted protein [Fibroporia radiculosa]
MARSRNARRKKHTYTTEQEPTPTENSMLSLDDVTTQIMGAFEPVTSNNRSPTLLENPRVVCADITEPGIPCFLYLSPTPGQADMVIIDYLLSVMWTIREAPTALQQPIPGHERELYFRIGEVPGGKGLGMVATRAIKAGELIHAERPVVISRPELYTTSSLSPVGDKEYYDMALSGLSPQALESFLALHNAFPNEGPIDPMSGILNTNSFDTSLKIGDGDDNLEKLAGCYPTLSRANHDCSPSANFHFSQKTFCGQFFATRDILEGEEITVTYTDYLMSHKERNRVLKKTYGFICTCRTCSLPPALVKESDMRRRDIDTMLKDAAEDTLRYPQPTELELRQLVRWAEQEGLWMTRGMILYHGSLILSVTDCLNVGFEWLKETRKVFRMLLGEDSLKLEHVDSLGRKMAQKLASNGVLCHWPTTALEGG